MAALAVTWRSGRVIRTSTGVLGVGWQHVVSFLHSSGRIISLRSEPGVWLMGSPSPADHTHEPHDRTSLTINTLRSASITAIYIKEEVMETHAQTSTYSVTKARQRQD